MTVATKRPHIAASQRRALYKAAELEPLWKRAVRRAIHPLRYDLVRRGESLGSHLSGLFELLEIDLVLDVGANLGQFGMFLRRNAGYRGRIISFEPVAETAASLRTMAEMRQPWDVHQCALGSTAGEAKINIAQSSDFSSFLVPSSASTTQYEEASTAVREEVVPVRRLDTIFDELIGNGERRVFLKTDTQGWDLDVLRGAGDRLSQISAIQAELAVMPLYAGSPGFVEVISFLIERRFQPSGFFTVSRDRALRLIEVDCVMVRNRSG